MNKKIYVSLVILGTCFFPKEIIAQDKNILPRQTNLDSLGNVSSKFQEYFFEALKQQAIENHEQAIVALEKCVPLKPEEAILYVELGKNHLALKNYPQAEKNFKLALEKRPEENRYILARLFEVYSSTKNYPEAIQTAKKLTRFDPVYFEDLANLQMMVKQPDRALRSLEKLDSLRGPSEYTKNLRREIFKATGDEATQIAYLKTQISENPNNQENYLRLINLYGKNEDFKAAFSWAKKLQKKYPDSEKVHLALYQLYMDQKEYGQAIASLKKVLSGNKLEEATKIKALNDFVAFTKENPEYEDELIALLDLAKKSSERMASNKELGGFYLKKDKEKALKYYTASLKNNFNDPKTIEQALMLQLELGKYKEAAKLGKKAIGIFPSRPSLYLSLGMAQNRLGEHQAAMENLELGLIYLIDNKKMKADFYRQMSLAQKGLGKTEKAVFYQNKADAL